MKSITDRPLNDVMSFDHVIHVDEDGTITEPTGIYAPELYDGELESGSPWSLLNGYSGQDRYAGPIMHPSEYIGGQMERDILTTPGYYVAIVSTTLPRWSVRLFDNGGETFDRYTAIYTDDDSGETWYRGMSENPSHPQGYGISGDDDCSGVIERDQEIDVDSAPDAVQRCIARDLEDSESATEPDADGWAVAYLPPTTCAYCHAIIRADGQGAWVDHTDGDCCSGDDALRNENGTHVPVAD